MIVTNSLIRWNTAGRHGGGLYKGTVADSVIASNTVTAANYYGGGYYGATAADDRLLNCEWWRTAPSLTAAGFIMR